MFMWMYAHMYLQVCSDMFEQQTRSSYEFALYGRMHTCMYAYAHPLILPRSIPTEEVRKRARLPVHRQHRHCNYTGSAVNIAPQLETEDELVNPAVDVDAGVLHVKAVSCRCMFIDQTVVGVYARILTTLVR